MLEQICAYIHNYFDHATTHGVYTIANNTLTLPLLDGQYFRIVGSALNDGVYQYPAYDMQNETFEGDIIEMRPPKAFLDIVKQIEDWQEKYGSAVSGPYQSESFGGYSYILKSGTNASGQQDSNAGSWQGVFKSYLNQWRKLC